MNQPTFSHGLLHVASIDDDTQRRGRHVIMMALGLFFATLCAAVVVAARPDGMITLLESVVMLVVYAATIKLARSGYVTVAGYLLTSATLLVIVVNALATQQLRMAPYALSVCVLLAGMTLSPLGVGVILFLSLIALGVFSVMLAGVPQQPVTLTDMLVMVGVLTGVTALISSIGSQGFTQTLASVQRARQAVEQSQAALREQATSDPLTLLANRRRFHDHLQAYVAQALAHTQPGCAVVVLDLDRFKTINDSLGHLTGDELLQAVAARLTTVVPQHDLVARLGGDEFAIVLAGITTADAALSIVDRIHACFRAPFVLHGHEVVTSASIGIALWTPLYQAPEDLLRDADSALYQAKAQGKARSALFDTAMYQAAMAQLQLEADLRHAVARNEFTLHYQPIVSLVTGAVIRVEALLRWQHPTRGNISPAEFVPVAEETGLIVALGAWALRAACTQLRTWHAQGWRDLGLAVNLSPRQFRHENLVAGFRAVLQETGVAAHQVEVELTESSLMADATAAMEQLQSMSDLGLQIAVDDFGTGYSSLAYLKRFPIDTLKIDRAFVTDCARTRQDAAIVAATIALAQSLGLHTVAEGVETEDQRAFLLAHGCETIQGYLVSRPLPVNALTAWLQSRQPVAACPAIANTRI